MCGTVASFINYILEAYISNYVPRLWVSIWSKNIRSREQSFILFVPIRCPGIPRLSPGIAFLNYLSSSTATIQSWTGNYWQGWIEERETEYSSMDQNFLNRLGVAFKLYLECHKAKVKTLFLSILWGLKLLRTSKTTV